VSKLAAQTVTGFDTLLLAHCIKIKMTQNIHALIKYLFTDADKKGMNAAHILDS
jgi:hypothetical protein